MSFMISNFVCIANDAQDVIDLQIYKRIINVNCKYIHPLIKVHVCIYNMQFRASHFSLWRIINRHAPLLVSSQKAIYISQAIVLLQLQATLRKEISWSSSKPLLVKLSLINTWTRMSWPSQELNCGNWNRRRVSCQQWSYFLIKAKLPCNNIDLSVD